jgi:hypothetical protein
LNWNEGCKGQNSLRWDACEEKGVRPSDICEYSLAHPRIRLWWKHLWLRRSCWNQGNEKLELGCPSLGP